MENTKTVRVPQQKRSIEKKERILEAAYALFCEKGFVKTNTPEIAARAGVSIGSLYSYYPDKREIFLEVLHRYEGDFHALKQRFSERMDEMQEQPMDWLRGYVNGLIEIHIKSAEFQRELKILYLSDAEVAREVDENTNNIHQIILNFLRMFQQPLQITDLEAAAMVIYLLVNGMVEYTFLYPGTVDRERVLDQGLTAIQRYLFG